MAELNLLQQVVLTIGGVGGALGIINTVQSWRKNRPVVSVNAGASPVDGDIEIVIANPAARPITIRRAHCIGGAHNFLPADYILYTEGATAADIHVEIAAGKSAGFKLIGRSRFVLFIFWHSNTAFIFSLLPLTIVRTKRQVERLRRTRRIDTDS